MNRLSARARLLLAVSLYFLAVACGGAPGPLAPPFPPGEQLPEGAQEPFRPKLILFVNAGQEDAHQHVLPAVECTSRDWVFNNIPVQPGDQVQVAAWDLEGERVYWKDLGTVPTLYEYLQDVLKNMTPEGERIVGALEGIPFGFHSMDALGEYHPDIDELHLGTDLESWPTEILLVVFAHEGSHALDDAEHYQFLDKDAIEAAQPPVMDANLALIAAQQIYNQAKTDEERAAAQQQLEQATRARDEAHATYQAFVDAQWPHYFETEVTGFQRELDVWRALGPPATDSWPSDSKAFASEENRLLSMSEAELRATLADPNQYRYLTRFVDMVQVAIPGEAPIEFKPTNLP